MDSWEVAGWRILSSLLRQRKVEVTKTKHLEVGKSRLWTQQKWSNGKKCRKNAEKKRRVISCATPRFKDREEREKREKRERERERKQPDLRWIPYREGERKVAGGRRGRGGERREEGGKGPQAKEWLSKMSKRLHDSKNISKKKNGTHTAYVTWLRASTKDWTTLIAKSFEALWYRDRVIEKRCTGNQKGTEKKNLINYFFCKNKKKYRLPTKINHTIQGANDFLQKRSPRKPCCKAIKVAEVRNFLRTFRAASTAGPNRGWKSSLEIL